MAKRKKTKLDERQNALRQEKLPCERCGNVTYLTVDHIVPKHLLEQLGLDEVVYEDERNWRNLCSPCNRFKGARIDVADGYAVWLLKGYVNLLDDSTTSNPNNIV